MVMWHSSLNGYIKVLPASSPAFQTILLKYPHVVPSLHTVIYLPTAGNDEKYVSVLSQLKEHVDAIRIEYPGVPHFVRGDANSNSKNTMRHNLLSHFSGEYSFERIPLHHPSYHHFVGDGLFDSEIDVILVHASVDSASEVLLQIICKLENPLIDSHHDIILSCCTLSSKIIHADDSGLVKAPTVPNERIKIFWTPEGIDEYEHVVNDSLREMRSIWGRSQSRSSISILLESTYRCLSLAAASTNKFTDLGVNKLKKASFDPSVRKSERFVLKCKRTLDLIISKNPTLDKIEEARNKLRSARTAHRRIVRASLSYERNKRDEALTSILSSNPSAAHHNLRKAKNAATSVVQTLCVGPKRYTGERVQDGFYDSLSALKAPDLAYLYKADEFQETLLDYENILKLTKYGSRIPPISPKESTYLILSLKADVNDFYSITASHFINAGSEGLEHFHFLMNVIIDEINLSSLEELNTIWACILYKGHSKDRESDRSYRTISTCPLIAKALDSYIGSLYAKGWQEAQAETQFQGPGSSHELAALLMTESINYSIHSLKQPYFLLLLDAKSAFDLLPRESIIVEAYKAGSRDQGLIYLDNRLKSRLTYCEWSKVLMGPIHDKLGVEQGGVNSDKLYKLANNNQLNLAQQSMLGVPLPSRTISCIGQADDTALQANSIFDLQALLLLTIEYCKRFNVTLVPEKIKLLAYCSPNQQQYVDYEKLISPKCRFGFSCKICWKICFN